MEKHKLIGKKVRLFPADTYRKIARIDDIDEYGFYFTILECHSNDWGFNVGDELFFNHGYKLVFNVLKD